MKSLGKSQGRPPLFPIPRFLEQASTISKNKLELIWLKERTLAKEWEALNENINTNERETFVETVNSS